MQQENLKEICRQTGLLIRETGNFIAAELGKVNHEAIELKSLNSLVSYVDKTAEEMLVAGCTLIVHEAGFITEEETIATSADKEWRWIIDPLDGTTNFLHQLPFFSISVALQRGGKTVVGLVYEVNRQELFSAYLGGGCQLNGKTVKVSETATLSDSLLATGFPYYDFEKKEAYVQLLGHLMPKTRGLRRLGSAALDLAYTACGRFDGFFEYSLAPWDVAAGAFLVEEAGGVVSDFSAADNYLFGKEMLAVNAKLWPEMADLMKRYFK